MPSPARETKGNAGKASPTAIQAASRRAPRHPFRRALAPIHNGASAAGQSLTDAERPRQKAEALSRPVVARYRAPSVSAAGARS